MHTLKSQLIKMLKLEGNMWFSLDCMTSIKSNLNYDTEDWIVASMVFVQLTWQVFSISKFLYSLIDFYLSFSFVYYTASPPPISSLPPPSSPPFLSLSLLFFSFTFNSIQPCQMPFSISECYVKDGTFLSFSPRNRWGRAGPGSPEDSAHSQLNFMVWTRLYSLEHVRNMSGVMLHPW